MSVRRWPALAVAFAALAACAPTAQPPQTQDARLTHVADVHRTKCGACHERVEPGMRSREELERALARHRNRVKLTEAEWGAMIDYLSRQQD